MLNCNDYNNDMHYYTYSDCTDSSDCRGQRITPAERASDYSSCRG
jgi:hypothetical protein